METKTLSQKIQNEIFQSVENLTLKKEIVTETDIIYNSLYNIGFSNISNVKLNKSISSINETNSCIDLYNNLVQSHIKMIRFKDLYTVLEKYDLYIAHVSFYKNEIPVDNAKDIIEYEKIKESRSKRAYNDIKTKPFTSNTAYYGGNNNYLICASLDNFDLTDCNIIGRQIFKDTNLKFKFKLPNIVVNPDPIILHPVVSGNELFDSKRYLDIVTAWDREANDEMIFDKFNNLVKKLK